MPVRRFYSLVLDSPIDKLRKRRYLPRETMPVISHPTPREFRPRAAEMQHLYPQEQRKKFEFREEKI